MAKTNASELVDPNAFQQRESNPKHLLQALEPHSVFEECTRLFDKSLKRVKSSHFVQNSRERVSQCDSFGSVAKVGNQL